MTNLSSQLRQAIGACGTVAIAAGALLALAPAASAVATSSKPVVTVTATPAEQAAEVTVVVNREAKQVHSATCTLDGQPIACGTPVSSKKTTTYAVGLSGLTAGVHTFAISIRLTDGGSAQGSATFESVAPAPTPASVCADSAGRYVEHLVTWECRHHFATAEEATAASGTGSAVMAPFCRGYFPLGYQVVTDPAGGVEGFFTCWRPSSWELRTSCDAPPLDGRYVWTADSVTCLTSNGAADAATAFVATCEQIAGAVSRVDGDEVAYTCAAA